MPAGRKARKPVLKASGRGGGAAAAAAAQPQPPLGQRGGAAPEAGEAGQQQQGVGTAQNASVMQGSDAAPRGGAAAQQQQQQQQQASLHSASAAAAVAHPAPHPLQPAAAGREREMEKEANSSSNKAATSTPAAPASEPPPGRQAQPPGGEGYQQQQQQQQQAPPLATPTPAGPQGGVLPSSSSSNPSAAAEAATPAAAAAPHPAPLGGGSAVAGPSDTQAADTPTSTSTAASLDLLPIPSGQAAAAAAAAAPGDARGASAAAAGGTHPLQATPQPAGDAEAGEREGGREPNALSLLELSPELRVPQNSLMMCRTRSVVFGIRPPPSGKGKAGRLRRVFRKQVRCGFDLCTSHGIPSLSAAEQRTAESLRLEVEAASGTGSGARSGGGGGGGGARRRGSNPGTASEAAANRVRPAPPSSAFTRGWITHEESPAEDDAEIDIFVTASPNGEEVLSAPVGRRRGGGGEAATATTTSSTSTTSAEGRSNSKPTAATATPAAPSGQPQGGGASRKRKGVPLKEGGGGGGRDDPSHDRAVGSRGGGGGAAAGGGRSSSTPPQKRLRGRGGGGGEISPAAGLPPRPHPPGKGDHHLADTEEEEEEEDEERAGQRNSEAGRGEEEDDDDEEEDDDDEDEEAPSDPGDFDELEAHVAMEVMRYAERESRRLPPHLNPPGTVFLHSAEGLEACRAISGKIILLIIELRSSNSRTGCYISRGINGSPKCLSEGVEVLTLTFASRLELLHKSYRCVASLAGRGNRIWACLVSHATSSGQTFSCTPKEIVVPTVLVEDSISTAEEFCSLADFVQSVQGGASQPEEILGIHIGCCSSMRYRKKVHEAWPVPSSWYESSLTTCLSGYTYDLHATDGCLVICALASFIAAHKVRSHAGYLEVLRVFRDTLAKDVGDACGLTTVSPGGKPRADTRNASYKPARPSAISLQNSSRGRATIVCYLSHDACSTLRAMMQAVQHAVKVRDDVQGSEMIIQELGESDNVLQCIRDGFIEGGAAPGLGAGANKFLFLVTGGSLSRAAIEEVVSLLDDAGCDDRFVTIGATAQINPLVLPHSCTQCCSGSGAQPREQPLPSSTAPGANPALQQATAEHPGRCSCAGRYAVLFSTLTWAVLLLCGEGWSLQEVEEELCMHAPGFVV